MASGKTVLLPASTCYTLPLPNNGFSLMQDPQNTTNFWIGNGLLAVALLILFFMDSLSQMLGMGAVALWMVFAAAGIYFMMKS